MRIKLLKHGRRQTRIWKSPPFIHLLLRPRSSQRASNTTFSSVSMTTCSHLTSVCSPVQSKQEAEGLGCDVVRVEVDQSLTKEQLLETFIDCGRDTHTHTETYMQHICLTHIKVQQPVVCTWPFLLKSYQWLMVSVRFSGPGSSVLGSQRWLCGGAAGGSGEGVLTHRPAGGPLPQSGHQGPFSTAAPQHGYQHRLPYFREPGR